MKRFEDRKNTVGVSLSNGVLIALDDYCERTGVNRSLLIEIVLRRLLRHEEELDDLLNEEGVSYERD